MLIHLKITNFALIDSLSLEFDGGLNVLTGETGAGKSILIDALQAALGGRVERDQIRDPKKSCVVEAVFTVDDPELRARTEISRCLAAEDECLILKREVTCEGRSKNYVNREFVNLSVLREIGRELADFHGAYDQQRIFEPAWHARAVDRVAGTAPLLAAYGPDYEAYAALGREREAMRARAEHRDRELDLLRYQVRELEKIAPQDGEDQKLFEERIRMGHGEKIHRLTGEILETLSEGEQPVSERLSSGFRAWLEWIRLDPSAEPLKKSMDEIQVNLESLIRSVSDYREGLSFSPERGREIDERLDALETIKRKYGGTLVASLAYLEEARAKLDQLENAELYGKEADEKLARLKTALEKQAAELTRLRKKAVPGLEKKVEKELADLGIRQARFECRMEKTGLSANGADRIEFYIRLNAGEELKPAAHIVSSGEASRIILALKRAMTAVEGPSTLIFDEIDANIGGRLGTVVGQKIKDIASERQVLLITHLPQIASFADRHIKVRKWTQGGTTRIEYAVLQGQDRVRELAQMMSGEKETEISREHARQMIRTAEKTSC